MSPAQIPLLRPQDVVKGFERMGWRVARQRGSHIILVKSGHIATLSVPNHVQVARGTLRQLLHRAGVTVEDFLAAVQ